MPKIGDYSQFVGVKQKVSNVADRALKATADDMLKKLKEIINEDTYGGGYKPKFYERADTPRYADMFEIERANKFGLGIKGQLKITTNEDKLEYYGNTSSDWESQFIHGNPWEGLTDYNFLKLMNKQIPTGDAYGFGYVTAPVYVHRKPFWDDFLKWANSEKGFNHIYGNYLRKFTGTKVKITTGDIKK